VVRVGSHPKLTAFVVSEKEDREGKGDEPILNTKILSVESRLDKGNINQNNNER